MKPITPPVPIADLFRRCEVAEVVIDHGFIGLHEEPVSEPSTHQRAALLALESFGSFSRRPRQMRPVLLDVSAFVGPYFDQARGKLVMRGRTAPHLNDYFCVGDEQPEGNIVNIEPPHRYCGYAYAFAEPMHGLDISDERAQQLFVDLKRELFNDFVDLVIYQWRGHWSDYFDESVVGTAMIHAFWTVHNPALGAIVGIGATRGD